MLRGFATVSYYAADLEAAAAWYGEVLGIEPYFQRPGYIEFLGPDNDTVIFTINLNELGIHRMSLEKSEANAEQIKRYKIELYMESMELVWNPLYIR